MERDQGVLLAPWLGTSELTASVLLTTPSMHASLSLAHTPHFIISLSMKACLSTAAHNEQYLPFVQLSPPAHQGNILLHVNYQSFVPFIAAA